MTILVMVMVMAMIIVMMIVMIMVIMLRTLVMIICNVGMLQLFWFKSLRRNLAVLFAVGLAVNVGMWFERFNIIVLSLEQDHLTSNWSYYRFTLWDYILLAGSFGMFFTQYLVFARVAPVAVR